MRGLLRFLLLVVTAFVGRGLAPMALPRARELPIVWKEPAPSATRVNLRSRFTAFCVRGWLREQVARSRLAFSGDAVVEVATPAVCAFDGSARGGARRASRVCADVIRVALANATWYGYDRDERGAPRLALSALDAEVTNLHRRVLTRGRRGAIRATAALTGADVDASSWLRGFLARLLARVLAEADVGGAEGPAAAGPSSRVADFSTTIERDGDSGAPRVNLAGRAAADGARFRVSLLLAVEHGSLVLRSPRVWVDRAAVRVRRLGPVAVRTESQPIKGTSNASVSERIRRDSSFSRRELGEPGRTVQ